MPWLPLPPLSRLLPAAVLALALLAPPARAAWEPPGVDLDRPRLLFRAADLPAIRAKIASDPFPAVLAGMLARIAQADGVSLADETKEAQRILSRAAKNLAFLYAVDRTLVGGQVVPFPSAAERQAAGDRARELLENLYPRNRLLVPPPLGGWDRDISTSEELLQWATAYDTLKGAGYDFGAAEAGIRARLVQLASELYWSYVDPAGSGSTALIHQNNHRSKVGASLVMAGVALAGHTPAPGTDPDGLAEPTNWIEYGLRQVDLIMRWALVAGDGAYGEGPFYLRFACENLLPFARAWDRLVDGATWDAGGVPVPSLWRHPLFRRSMLWQLHMTLPDGSLVPQDDGNPGRSHFFGAAPPGIDDAAFAWRWAHAPEPWEADGNVDLGADSIVVHDPDVVPAPPAGSPTAFFPEGGNAVFRSDWSADAVVAVVQAERDEAAEFGRDRQGRGVFPESHEHAEPGAFVLHAFGERLALDPGYFSFGERYKVNRPEHHNVILVDGKGPLDPLGGSLFWELDPFARPPIDGMASLVDAFDSGFLDAARVIVRYGTGSYFTPPPYAGTPRIERRFLFAGDRYLAAADRIDPEAGPHTYAWQLHGNAGGTSGGRFEATATGGRWTRGAARLDAGWSTDAGAPAFATREAVHEEPYRVERTHVALEASVRAGAVRGVQLLYPTRSGDPPPVVAELGLAGMAGLRLDDAAAGRTVLLAHRAPAAGSMALPPPVPGAPAFRTDGHLALVEVAADGSLVRAWVEGARVLEYGAAQVRSLRPGNLGLAPGADAVEVVADAPGGVALVRGLPFPAAAADGACRLGAGLGAGPGGGGVHGALLWLSREPRVVLRAAPGNAAPAADPGPTARAPLGTRLRLDGRASCDADGDALAPRWELVSAPPGSDWQLDGADGWQPELLVDRPGPYRVRLVVTDAAGAASAPREVLVRGGDRCEGGFDEDRDGRIDSDDPDCDAGSPAGL